VIGGLVLNSLAALRSSPLWTGVARRLRIVSGNGRSRQVEQARPRLGAVWEKKGRSEGNGRRRDFFGPSGLRGPLAALTWALGRPTLFNLVSRVSCLHRRRGRRKEMEGADAEEEAEEYRRRGRSVRRVLTCRLSIGSSPVSRVHQQTGSPPPIRRICSLPRHD
jgi:hypothetical protein